METARTVNEAKQMLGKECLISFTYNDFHGQHSVEVSNAHIGRNGALLCARCYASYLG